MTTATRVPSPPAAAPATGPLPPLWRTGVAVIAAGFTALEMGLSARYGFHRDELYFLACARHLAWGYVDQPPFVPATAWLATHLFGTSPTTIRVFPALAGGVTVLMTASMARELRGGRKAQAIAALAAATSPQVLGAFHLLSPTPFDMFFWAAICFAFLRFLRTGDQRLWLLIGLLAGVGLLNKLNVAFLIFGLGLGLLLARRGRTLLSPWAACGAGIVLLIWLPNIVWNAQHDWAALSMLHALHAENSSLGASLEFIPSQFFVVGPVLIVLWLAGLRRALTSPMTKPIGIAYLVLLLLFTLGGAKPYYLAGMYFVLFASGGVWAEARLDRRQPARGLRGWIALMLVGLVMALPLTLPVVPESAMPKGSWIGNVDKDLSATVGWPRFVRQIADVAATVPPGQRAASRRLHRRLRRRRCDRPIRRGVRPAARHQRSQLLLVVGSGRRARRRHDHRGQPTEELSPHHLLEGETRQLGVHAERRLDRGAGRTDLDLHRTEGLVGGGLGGRPSLRLRPEPVGTESSSRVQTDTSSFKFSRSQLRSSASSA